MKAFVLAAAIVAAATLVTAPADGAAEKRKKVTRSHAPVTTPYARRNSNRVYDSDGTALGADPDPFIRSQIRRDPRPWDGPD